MNPYIEFENRFDSFTTSLFDPSLKRNITSVKEILDEFNSIIDIMSASARNTSALGVLDPNHVLILQKQGSQWLTSTKNYWQAMSGTEDVDNLLHDIESTKSRLLEVSAKSTQSSGSGVIKQWTFKPDIQICLQELSFEECAYGWQTWSGGILLAYLIALRKIPEIETYLIDSDESGQILELGCGTGVVGVTLGKVMLQSQGSHRGGVVMTDYLDSILENARGNVARNGCDSVCRVEKLDWRDNERAGSHKLIIAADVCYELEHGNLVPPVCQRFLSCEEDAKVVILSTLRGDRFAKEIMHFEARMSECGFSVERKVDIDQEWVKRLGNDADELVKSIFNGPDQEFRLYTFVKDSV
ncbi:hypothetical protein BCR33DRAFT_520245 [Rhizoclosmatium globosum]|uniref:S-adenosyl-L-methionine-dependent methyltransferase n=1 Tax=Rhizoclosmatium globosum TaxID=329046 RepID=A0A1Y2BFN4_9FUNG|nr:hypothetical protein BCR33DRAFT_520245 [Rhizoclosmatium globosum]|eukprot:ORY33619.1 hypothetical protein BCR33DRAFT_520245 [Rhizoclosmatium globosum]